MLRGTQAVSHYLIESFRSLRKLRLTTKHTKATKWGHFEFRNANFEFFLRDLRDLVVKIVFSLVAAQPHWDITI
jgi:hypothetical protein